MSTEYRSTELTGGPIFSCTLSYCRTTLYVDHLSHSVLGTRYCIAIYVTREIEAPCHSTTCHFEPFERLPKAPSPSTFPPMISLLLAWALFSAPAPIDSLARRIAVAPAESIQVTAVGPVDGPAVVIVPGLVSPAYAFRKVLPPLAEAGVRAVVVEPLGVGRSSRPGDADYSHTAQARRVASVMDSLGIKHAVVMGHAVGTAIALRLAVARPELVKSLMLVEGGALESAAVPGVKKALQFAFIVKIFAGKGRIKKEVKKGLMASSGDTTWVTDSLVERYVDGPAGDMGAVLRALKGMNKSVEADSLLPHLDHIQIPVLLMLGGAAHEGGPSSGRIRTLERHIHHLKQRMVYGAGLHIHEEQPAVVVEELLALVHQGAT